MGKNLEGSQVSVVVIWEVVRTVWKIIDRNLEKIGKKVERLRGNWGQV